MIFENIINEPINNSWMISLLRQQFQSSTIIDCWNIGLNSVNIINIDSRKSTKSIINYFSENYNELLKDNNYIIVCFDDEIFELQEGAIEKFFYEINTNFFNLLDKIIFIFKTEKLFSKIKNIKIKKIIFPYFDAMEDLISLNKLKKYPYNIPIDDNISFFSLNGTYNDLRKLLLLTLSKFNLFESGYVTCNLNKRILSKNNRIPNYILEQCKKDKFAEEVYFKTEIPCDRLYYKYENIPCTLNLKNYFYISENIPGSIYLGVESFNSINLNNSMRSPSDKTILPFICKRLPLLIGEHKIIDTLRNYGFDMFDDILDHSHDFIEVENYQEKIAKCVIDNFNILKKNNFLQNNEINSRLEYNQKHLIDIWYNNALDKFIGDIKKIINY